jgi:hypothetical protein
MSKRDNPFRPRGPIVRSAATPRAPSAPTLDAREVETADRRIEVRVTWGESTVLHVAHLERGATFSIGDQAGEATFVVGRDALGMSTLPLVTYEDDRAWLAIPLGSSLTRAREGEPERTETIAGDAETSREWTTIELEPRTAYRVRHRAFMFSVREVAAGKRVTKRRPFDWGFLGHFAAVGLVFAGLLFLSSLTPRSAGALSPPRLDPSNRYIQHAIMMAEQLDRPVPQADAPKQPAAEAVAAADPERRPLVRRPVGPSGPTGSGGREDWRERASTTAVATALQAMAGMLPGTPSWVSDSTLGPGAMPLGLGGGSPFGDLGLRDTPRVGVPIGTIDARWDGLIPVGPPGDARGPLGARTANVPPPAPRVEMEAKGGLEREIVRRVVRRNEAQVRYCYERALQGNPDLAGRVELKFLIAPSGAVQSAAVQRTEIGREVGECIAGAVRRMSFPAPEGGIVAVSYSWTFRAR